MKSQRNNLFTLSGKYKMTAVLPVIFLWAAFAALFYRSSLEFLENYLYDIIYQRVSPADSRIAVIGIDDASMARLGQWPWSRKLMAEAVDKLTEGGAAAVAIDVLFDTPGAREPGEDESLAAALRRAGNVILPVQGVFKRRMAARMEADGLLTPLPALRVKRLAHVNSVPEDGGVMRRGFLDIFYGGERYGSLAYEAAKIYRGADFRNEIPLDAAGRLYIKFTGRAGWYHPISFADVLEGKVPPQYFKGKIVLIGFYAQGIAKDWYFTSIDRDKPTYGVEIHANMLQQFLAGDYLKDLPRSAARGVFVLFTAAAAAVFILYKPKFYTLAALLAVSGAPAYMAAKNGYVAPVLYAPLFCLAAYFTSLTGHYVQERRDKKRIKAAFGRYMAPQVLETILRDGEEGLKLEGTPRSVTVMFVDIRDFTKLSDGRNPKEVVLILNKYFDFMATCIHRNKGILDKFIGDAVMAVWGAPYDTGNHAEAAVKAAGEMRGGAAALSRELTDMYGTGISFGIGINSGDAVIGNIGASFRMDYTAIGDTVNIASRLESEARAGEILITCATYQMLTEGKRKRARFLREWTPKGKTEEIPIYEVTEEGQGL